MFSVIVFQLITYVNFLHFLENDDRMLSKSQNLSALVFLINSATKVNLICSCFSVVFVGQCWFGIGPSKYTLRFAFLLQHFTCIYLCVLSEENFCYVLAKVVPLMVARNQSWNVCNLPSNNAITFTKWTELEKKCEVFRQAPMHSAHLILKRHGIISLECCRLRLRPFRSKNKWWFRSLVV